MTNDRKQKILEKLAIKDEDTWLADVPRPKPGEGYKEVRPHGGPKPSLAEVVRLPLKARGIEPTLDRPRSRAAAKKRDQGFRTSRAVERFLKREGKARNLPRISPRSYTEREHKLDLDVIANRRRAAAEKEGLTHFDDLHKGKTTPVTQTRTSQQRTEDDTAGIDERIRKIRRAEARKARVAKAFDKRPGKGIKGSGW